jgi:acyl-ACP thioesterase
MYFPSPPPAPSLLHQLYNGYIYATAHMHDVDGQTEIRDGCAPVDIDAGFEVAPGDVVDIEVANEHPWGTRCLVFSDGQVTATALMIADDPSDKGTVL